MQSSNSLELKKILLIAASTGGPGQVQKIVATLPKLYNTAVLIAQHMASDFMPSYAKRLQEISKNRISLSEEHLPLEAGIIYIVQGESEVLLETHGLCFKQRAQHHSLYNPDINLLFHSFVPFVSEYEILCIVLTGIGNDGVLGCKMLSDAGAKSMTESSLSAIVDGMPSRARESIAAIEVGDIEEIVKSAARFCR